VPKAQQKIAKELVEAKDLVRVLWLDVVIKVMVPDQVPKNVPGSRVVRCQYKDVYQNLVSRIYLENNFK
jgi:hypothetical protein